MTHQAKAHAISIEPNPNRVRVHFNGRIVADSRSALTLQEGSRPVQYIPRADADMSLLARPTTAPTARSRAMPVPARGRWPGGGERRWTSGSLPAVAAIRTISLSIDRVDEIEELAGLMGAAPGYKIATPGQMISKQAKYALRAYRSGTGRAGRAVLTPTGHAAAHPEEIPGADPAAAQALEWCRAVAALGSRVHCRPARSVSSCAAAGRRADCPLPCLSSPLTGAAGVDEIMRCGRPSRRSPRRPAGCWRTTIADAIPSDAPAANGCAISPSDSVEFVEESGLFVRKNESC
jgi:hypothetical protein